MGPAYSKENLRHAGTLPLDSVLSPKNDIGDTPLKPLIFTLGVLIACSHLAFGQAMPTATRHGDLQVGGGFAANFPDYTPDKFYGYTIYADLDFTEHLGIEGEFRQTSDTTERIGGGGTIPQYQRNFEVGLRYFRHYGRFVPYAKVLYGRGVLEYPPYPYPANQAIPAAIESYNFLGMGTGTDLIITQHIRARFDFEYQKWPAAASNLLPIDPYVGKGGLPQGLTPILYTGGIAWRFGSDHYVPRGSQRDYRIE